MFYTMEEAAVLGGFLELYLDRDSVDPAVRERHRKFRQGLMRGALERADYEWAAATLGFLRPQWWPEHECSPVDSVISKSQKPRTNVIFSKSINGT